jgi:hypothetical protein
MAAVLTGAFMLTGPREGEGEEEENKEEEEKKRKRSLSICNNSIYTILPLLVEVLNNIM